MSFVFVCWHKYQKYKSVELVDQLDLRQIREQRDRGTSSCWRATPGKAAARRDDRLQADARDEDPGDRGGVRQSCNPAGAASARSHWLPQLSSGRCRCVQRKCIHTGAAQDPHTSKSTFLFQSAANSAAMGGAYRAVYLAQGGAQVGAFSQVEIDILCFLGKQN